MASKLIYAFKNDVLAKRTIKAPANLPFLPDHNYSATLGNTIFFTKETAEAVVFSSVDYYQSLSYSSEFRSDFEQLENNSYLDALKYEFLNYEEAKEHLEDNLNLLSLLKNAYSKIVQYFDSDRIFVKFTESLDTSELFTLRIIINTFDDVDSALEKQQNFNDNYWYQLPFDMTKNIIIDFDFQ